MLYCLCSAACKIVSLQSNAYRFPMPFYQPNHSIILLGYKISSGIIFYFQLLIGNSHMLLLNYSNQVFPASYILLITEPTCSLLSSSSLISKANYFLCACFVVLLIDSTTPPQLSPQGYQVNSIPDPPSPPYRSYYLEVVCEFWSVLLPTKKCSEPYMPYMFSCFFQVCLGFPLFSFIAFSFYSFFPYLESSCQSLFSQ